MTRTGASYPAPPGRRGGEAAERAERNIAASTWSENPSSIPSIPRGVISRLMEVMRVVLAVLAGAVIVAGAMYADVSQANAKLPAVPAITRAAVT